MHFLLLLPLRLLSLYLGLTLTFYALSRLSIPKASYYYRVLASFGALILCATYGVFASLALRLVGQHRISQWATARAFHYIMALTTGVGFDIISGSDYLQRRPVVFIGNHQSELDVLLLGAVFPKYCSVTAKSSLARVPFLGWFMALSGTVFIDRANSSEARKAFQGAAEEMKRERQSVFIFPEGTRSHADGPVLGVFKKGAFHLAVRAGVEVVPIVCANYWGVLSLKERRFRGGRIPVKVLPPIPTSHLTAADVDDLTRTTRDLMLKELVELTESPLGQKATKATVEAGEDDLAMLATPSGARASGVER